jgi:hypothetical protein
MTFAGFPDPGIVTTELQALPGETLTLELNIAQPESGTLDDAEVPKVSGTPTWTATGGITVTPQGNGFSATVVVPNVSWGTEQVVANVNVTPEGPQMTQAWSIVEGSSTSN